MAIHTWAKVREFGALHMPKMVELWFLLWDQFSSLRPNLILYFQFKFNLELEKSI